MSGLIIVAKYGGGDRIRTCGTLTDTPVFKTDAFNHSATPPYLKQHSNYIRNYSKLPQLEPVFISTSTGTSSFIASGMISFIIEPSSISSPGATSNISSS